MGVDLVEALHVDDQTTRVLGRVAVGAAHAAGDDATLEVVGLVSVIVGNLLDGRDDGVEVFRAQNLRAGRGRAAPAVQGGFAGV